MEQISAHGSLNFLSRKGAKIFYIFPLAGTQRRGEPQRKIFLKSVNPQRTLRPGVTARDLGFVSSLRLGVKKYIKVLASLRAGESK
jgi:hypothetical protein